MVNTFQSLALAAVLAFLAGNQSEAPTAVHDTVADYVHAIVSKSFRGEDLADLRDDVEQATHLRIRRLSPRLEAELDRNSPGSHLKDWTGSVTTKVCHEFRKKRRKRSDLFVPLPQAALAVDPRNRLREFELKDGIQLTLSQLALEDPRHAIVIELQLLGCSPQEIAEGVNADRDPIYRLGHAARQHFKRIYFELDGNRAN